ncbi:hypothetical protein POSPLADRAFT_1131483 [Postia placenta MAD-698-R-SB12]|uniref:NADH:flavin oxidoreductase/NADH oxidase N-terminal domain-containing protein n=1 Tax=Postia placenta MAD-698-R-SB12 TaxID=670580 RepID=A0A1X6NBF4_9APHY|nr:hypothetical protein POSPLADRAFT_1131483 [Postia placenta MAD-698-R-SB12]OSX65904.1 hypothetical protein POSPLADRAFT_1131483 [Postia placenta MAD-698-R-SB12]
MLSHRVVLAPLTRYRADKEHVHTDLGVEYYGQRASIPGTLLITEATFVSPQASGYDYPPGIWNEEQVEAWRRITSAVHAKGSRIFCQLWALGRVAQGDILARLGLPVVSASDIPIADHATPHALTIPEIKEYVQMFTAAAVNAMRAGFDGVELHGANGYLIDQFFQDMSNKRTDAYGGSIANRCRFALELIDSISKAIGEDKTAIRISPWSRYQDMRMTDPRPTFSHFVSCLVERHPNLAYIHVIEPRIDQLPDQPSPIEESNDFLRKVWAPRAYIAAGGFTRDLALQTSEQTGDLVAFGRAFLANPDLPLRLAKDLPLMEGDRDTYYTPESARGYTDYPFVDDSEARK